MDQRPMSSATDSPAAAVAKPSVAFVVAHPDDVAFSQGGTASLLSERYAIHVLCATRGDRGYSWKGEGRTPPSPETAATRSAEEAAACALLGAELTFLGQTDGDIYADQPTCERLAGLIDTIRPVAVFTLGPLEKPDHALVSVMATKALHLADRFWTTELYMTLRDVETYNAHYADVFVNITRVIEQKRALVRCHKTQAPDEAAAERVLDRNRRLGHLCRCDYAEAYMSGLPLVASRWGRKAGCILMDLGA